MTEAASRSQPGAGRIVTSAAQDSLWFLQELVPDAGHNLCRAYRITGKLDVESLRAAWRTLIERHEILRTTLAKADGRPMPVIGPPGGDLTFVDLVDGSSVGGPNDRAERLYADLSARPFVLAEGPLARLTLARLDAEDHLVLLVLHRVVADDRSATILLAELSECYSTRVECRPAALAGSSPPYAEYARRQREQVDGPEFNRLLRWWAAALTPLPPPLTLPTDRARPMQPSVTGGAVSLDWGEDLSRALLELCAATGTTPFTALLTAFQTLLHRYSAEDRVAVGCPTTVRPGSQFEHAIGPFHNLLVLSADFSGTPTFAQMLARVGRLARDAYDHGELPFSSLVAALNVDRDPHRVPLCDAMFVFAADQVDELRLPGATVQRKPAHSGSTWADLTLTVDHVEPSVAVTLAYRDSLFEEASIRLILEQLRTLLYAALKEPGLPVNAIPLENTDRIRAAVREADLTAVAEPVDRAVHELVRGYAARQPDAEAVAWEGEGISYRDLTRQAELITGRLRSLGGVAGAPVAVRMPTGPRQVAVLLGALDAGAHLVCLGAGDTGERGRMILADLRPAGLIVDGEQVGDDVSRWYQEEQGGWLLDMSALDGSEAGPGTFARSGLDERAYIAYTSGSTGRPKGIAQTHRSLTQFVQWLADECRIGPGSRVAQWAAPGYDASLCEIFAALGSGATLCPVPERIRVEPKKLVDWLVEERITLFQTVPSFARELLRAILNRDANQPLPRLDHVLLAGEALAGELATELRRTLPSVRLVNLYGPTEVILATWHEVAGAAHGTVPIGRPIPGRQVLVLDERDRPCPAGVTGQIVIRSPYLTRGYTSAEAGGGSAFASLHDREEFGISSGECYRTGDLGRRRWDGLLEFRGRSDFQIKFYGTRLELTEIEAALTGHDSVAECAVVPAVDRSGLVTRLLAYVVPWDPPSAEEGASAAAWRAHLRHRFGRLMPPVSFKTMRKLPRNIGGKVDRRALPAPRSFLASTVRRPHTDVEKQLAAIWSELLGVHDINANDTFFSAGGHSLLIPQLQHRIRERFGAVIPLRKYLAEPTLAGMSSLVESATREGMPPVEP